VSPLGPRAWFGLDGRHDFPLRRLRVYAERTRKDTVKIAISAGLAPAPAAALAQQLIAERDLVRIV
jgi:hypothetical protein